MPEVAQRGFRLFYVLIVRSVCCISEICGTGVVGWGGVEAPQATPLRRVAVTGRTSAWSLSGCLSRIYSTQLCIKRVHIHASSTSKPPEPTAPR